MASSYDIPSWAGKPPTGLHLDVLKEDKLVQKLMVDEKRCYLFGRNNQMNDFCIDHASCSRVHAAFVYHKHLNIAYLVDLGSTHGTFIGSLQLEAHKPTQLQINTTFHFGASTRRYILRERPSAGQRLNIMEDLPVNETNDGALLGLPETQTELDNLTEYNTAHNRRISMLGIADDNNIRKQKQAGRRQRNVTFNDEEIIINPEDVDPNVGRFRNLVQTTVIPTKRSRFESNHMGIHSNSTTNINSGTNNTNHQIFQYNVAEMKQNLSQTTTQSATVASSSASLYHGLPNASNDTFVNNGNKLSGSDFDTLGSKLGLLLPNPAPDVTPTIEETFITPVASKQLVFGKNKVQRFESDNGSLGPQKKKYAKEAWPGRKPMLGQL